MKQAQTAEILHDLVDYEGPQLELLKSDLDRYMFGVAVRSGDLGEYANILTEPFFACEVRDRIYERYFFQRFDLHYTFTKSIGGVYYLYDLETAVDDAVDLIVAPAELTRNQALWPQTGFFASSHTTSYNINVNTGITKTFKIDGKWVADDFSTFHGKMSDLYALFLSIRTIERQRDNNRLEINIIREFVRSRYWRGGGSYVGFYDDLAEHAAELEFVPLEVASIQYASPGVMKLRGDGGALGDVSDIVSTFDEREREMSRVYKSIHSVLHKDGLLRAPPNVTFSNKAFEQLILRSTNELASLMHIGQQQSIFEACDRNVLVYAKVILSIFRRANELHVFQAQGRVQPIISD